MADFLQDASNWLRGVMRDHVSQTITYHRGADSVQLQATIGKTNFQILDRDGNLVPFESRDYLFQAADLVLGGITTQPERGDQVKETKDGETYVYELLSGGNQNHWRWSDRNHTRLRVHTKFYKTE